jgi:hypothetical protein
LYVDLHLGIGFRLLEKYQKEEEEEAHWFIRGRKRRKRG